MYLGKRDWRSGGSGGTAAASTSRVEGKGKVLS